MSARKPTPPPDASQGNHQRSPSRDFATTTFAKDSALISALSLLGVAGAFLLDVVVAAKFGLGYRTDAFFIALAIPQLIWSILTSACTRALTPLFTQLLDEEGEAETWHVFSILSSLSLVTLPVVAAAGLLLSPLLISITGAGLDEQTASLAIVLNRLLFLMLVPAGLIQVMKAVLNAHNHFAAPAATTLLQYGITVVVLLALESRLDISAVAVGYLLSTVGQVVVLGGVILAKGGRYTPSMDFRHPEVGKTARLITPPLSAEVLAQSIVIIERALASFLPPGSVSALAYGGRILRALDITFLNSVVVAILPRLSSLATARDTEGVKRFISLGLRVAWAATIPVTAVVLALAQPIVSLLFKRGAFDSQAASLTAMVLSMYMVGFTFLVMLRILLSTFYAFQDTKTPFCIRVGMLGLNLTADLILLPVMGVLGLALATSFTYAVNCIPAAWFLRKRIGPLRLSINRYLAKTVAAALAMGTVAWVLNGQLHQMIGGTTFLRQLLAVGLSTLLGGIVYLVALILLRLEELAPFLKPLRARLPLGRP